MSFLKTYPSIQSIIEIAKRRKTSVFLVGGYLRDKFLNRACCDFDFAVEKDALSLAKSFAKKIKGAYVLLDEDNGCARVVKKKKDQIFTFDFADFRAKTLKGDLTHRDFTINTLIADLNDVSSKSSIDEHVIDYKGAIKDLKLKKIKMASLKAFKEDPLRLLRAYSLRAMLNFNIEKKTLDQIKKDKDLIIDVSFERIREELFKIFATKNAGKILKEMDRIGLLENIIPQITVMYNVKQGTYHHLDVWPHSLETVVQLEKLFTELKNTDVNVYLDESFAGPRTRRDLMKLAALLHDIGKPETRKREGGRISFHGHEHVGRCIVKSVAKLLKVSTKERHVLEDLVRWHLRPGYLSNFKKPSEKAIFRYFRDTKDEGVSVLLLSLADQRSTRGPATTKSDQKHHEKICLSLVKRYFKKKKEKPRIRLVTGNDLITTLKLKPSPLFSKILKEIEEAQALGKIKTKKEALTLAKGIIKK